MWQDSKSTVGMARYSGDGEGTVRVQWGYSEWDYWWKNFNNFIFHPILTIYLLNCLVFKALE